MNFAQPLIQGTFLQRLNRFAAEVEINGRRAMIHVPNSGRMGELLIPGATVHLALAAKEGRKTSHDLTLVEHEGLLVAVDSRQPPKLLAEAILSGKLPELGCPQAVRSEVKLGNSRLDLAWEEEGNRIYLEAKSVTLVREGVALFPDAPTERGRRHLEELTDAGIRGMVVFVIQRADAIAFRANGATDPAFAIALEKAAAAGVEVYAYNCRVSLDGIEIGRRIICKL